MVRERLHDAQQTASEALHRASDRAAVGMHRMSESMGESPITRTAGRVPSDLFLIGAAGSIVGSLVLKLVGRDRDAQFVGQWAPTFMTLGLLSKLVEHDHHSEH